MVRVLVQRAARPGTSTSASRAEMLRLRPHDADELSHYSSGTSDVEFLLPVGLGRARGHRPADRLRPHAARQALGRALEYFDQARGERYVPYVIEPAAGATRTMVAFLLAAYDEDEVGGETRTVLRLHPRLAPYKVAVLPAVEEGDAEPHGQARSTGC